MNILMALSQLEVTGAEVYATTVGDSLTTRGHTVSYVSDTLTKAHIGQFFSLRFNKRSVPRRFWHVAYLLHLIKKNNIQVVHAHSRASSWSCYVACKLANIPLVTTVHGKQPVHASRKRFHALGERAMPVCEAIFEQLIHELNVPKTMLEVSRNGIDTSQYQWQPAPQNARKVITIIGRLTGPKGDLCYRLLNECIDLNAFDVQVISASKQDARFAPFADKVRFLGYSNDIPRVLAQADLVIGAGRVAMEALLCGRPTFAIGEACSIGLVDEKNIAQAMASNFGDIGSGILQIDFATLGEQIAAATTQQHCEASVSEIIKKNYDLQAITTHLEQIYQSVYVRYKKKEIPVLMYHRFFADKAHRGNHSPSLDIKMFEKHLKLLKFLNFETLTFADFAQNGLVSRLAPGKRYCMITVDDGFKDNYHLMLPLLQKYNFKAVVYCVTGTDHNAWDVLHPTNPEQPFSLMTDAEIKAMADSGCIEIGGHTLHHPHLDTLSHAEQLHEIVENKQQLKKITGQEILSFAYPYGDWNDDSVAIAKAHFAFAVATNSGPLALHEAPHLIRRIGIYPGTDTLALARKITGGYLFRKSRPKQKRRAMLLLKLRNRCKIDPCSTLTIGRKTRIRCCTINIRGQNNRLIIENGANLRRVHLEIEGNDCTIRIGKESVIGENCYLSAKEDGITLSIGERCMFSRNIKIMTSDGHGIFNKNNMQRINPAKNVTIGDNVWLADNVVVLKGSHIGDASVIGINSIVTQAIPAHCIATGMPATVKKTDIIWQL